MLYCSRYKLSSPPTAVTAGDGAMTCILRPRVMSWCCQHINHVQAVRSVGRAVGHTVSTVATLGCFKHGQEPPKLHLDATFYRVGAEEVKAIARGETSQQVLFVE